MGLHGSVAVLPAPATQSKVDVPSSYPTLNELLSRLIATNPFDKPVSSLDPYTGALPQSDFVAENNGTTVVQVGMDYMMRSPDGAWSSLEGIDTRARAEPRGVASGTTRASGAERTGQAVKAD